MWFEATHLGLASGPWHGVEGLRITHCLALQILVTRHRVTPGVSRWEAGSVMQLRGSGKEWAVWHA